MHEVNFPPLFQSRMMAVLGDHWEQFESAHHLPAPVSIRINPRKEYIPAVSTPIPWTSLGKSLHERPIFTLDPLFHAGAYYVQEASSMFLEQAIRQTTDLSGKLRVLDVSAAPGGKSTHLLSLLNHESLLVSNEVIRSRAAVLSENIEKWGYPNVLVTNNDPADFSHVTDFFDLIVLDAPCSGEGLFRKDPNTVNEWSEENVNICSARQRRILDDVWPALKENGVLIYCTCTYNEKENENNLASFSKENNVEFVELNIDHRWGIVPVAKENVRGYRFFPHRVNGEGFFLSVIRKKGNTTVNPSGRYKTRLIPASREITDRLKKWITGPDAVSFFQHNELVFFLPTIIVNDIEFLLQHLRFVFGGTNVATVKYDKLIPEHGLALSTFLDRKALSVADVDLSDAIRYLKKESIVLPNHPKGFTLITYRNMPIGWVNNLQNRTNNLYPSERRIRMAAPWSDQ